MIAFEVSIDGRRACTAGVSAGVTSVIATWVCRPSRDPESGEPAAETEAADPPRSREREDPARVAGRKREYYERLKREHGEA